MQLSPHLTKLLFITVAAIAKLFGVAELKCLPPKWGTGWITYSVILAHTAILRATVLW